MEKKIDLIMKENGDIEILCDAIPKHTILHNDRQITATRIIDIFDFNLGNTYKVTKQNSINKDTAVLDFFTQLLTDIAQKVNSISNSDLQDEDLPF